MISNSFFGAFYAVCFNRERSPESFQELLESQWNQGAQFLIQKATNHDGMKLVLHDLYGFLLQYFFYSIKDFLQYMITNYHTYT